MSTRSRPPGFGLRLLLAAAWPALLVIGVASIPKHVDNVVVTLLIITVIVSMATIGGRPAAIVASLSSALWFDVVLTGPAHSLHASAANDAEIAILFVAVGFLVGTMVERSRRQAARAAVAQSQLAELLRQAELLSGADNPGRLVALAVQELTERLDLKSCRFVRGAVPSTMPEIRHGAIRVPAETNPAGRGLVAIPVRSSGRTQGHFVLAFPHDTVGISLSPEQRRTAVALADLVGARLLRLSQPRS